MYKLLFIGDVHADDIGTSSRRDNYLESILKKLEESFMIAKQKKCDAIIFLGDIFHKMEPSGNCRNEILKFLLKNDDIEKYTLIGNHDVRNHLGNLDKSALGTLISAGVIQYNNYIEKYQIAMHDHYTGIEKNIPQLVKQDAIIHVAHANISSTPKIYEHVLASSLVPHSSCKFVIAGHIHEKMIVQNDDFTFINPGSLCRIEFKDYHVSRDIEVLYIEYDVPRNHYKYEMIKLENVKPGIEIFNVELKNNIRNDKEDIIAFAQKVNDYTSAMIKTDDYNKLREIAIKEGIESDVIELIIDTMMTVRENKNK